MTARYEFWVTEQFRATGTYVVEASTREEALAKVRDGQGMTMGDLDPVPSRPMQLRDVRRGKRIDTQSGDPS